MRKLLARFAAALLAVSAASMWAAADPSPVLAQVGIKGFIYQDIWLEFGASDIEGTDLVVYDPWVRLLVTGDVNDRLTVNVRLTNSKKSNGDAGGAGLLKEAYVAVRDLAPGLSLRVGRQKINWTVLQEKRADKDLFWAKDVKDAGNGFQWFLAPALRLDYAASPFTVSVYYALGDEQGDKLRGRRIDLFSREEVAARATYTARLHGADVLLGGMAVLDFKGEQTSPGDGAETAPGGEDAVGWGVQARVGTKRLGALYGEYGQRDADRGDTFWRLGVKVSLLETAGISGFVERDIRNDASAFEFAKKLNDYLELILGATTLNDNQPGDDEWRFYVVTRFGMAL